MGSVERLRGGLGTLPPAGKGLPQLLPLCCRSASSFPSAQAWGSHSSLLLPQPPPPGSGLSPPVTPGAGCWPRGVLCACRTYSHSSLVSRLQAEFHGAAPADSLDTFRACACCSGQVHCRDWPHVALCAAVPHSRGGCISVLGELSPWLAAVWQLPAAPVLHQSVTVSWAGGGVKVSTVALVPPAAL